MATILKVIVFVIVFLSLSVGLYFGYDYIKDKLNRDEEPQKQNLFLSSIDINGNQIETGFKIIFTGSDANSMSLDGVTLKEGKIQIEIPINRTFFVLNNNLENQSYYTSWKEDKIESLNDRNINLVLFEPKEIEVIELTKNSNMRVVRLIKRGFVPMLQICLRWSSHISTVNIEGLNVSDIPDRHLGKLDKCYAPMEIDNATVLNISYSTFGELNDESIKLWFVDYDVRDWTLFSEEKYIPTDMEGNDIGFKDYFYTLKLE